MKTRFVFIIMCLCMIMLFALSATALADEGNARFAILTGDEVSVRAEASTQSPKLGTLNRGQKLVVVGASGEFYKIRYKMEYGFISDKFVAIQPAKASKVNADYVILRDGPSIETVKIDSLNTGDTVNVYQKEGEYYQVTFEGNLGYISSHYIDIGKEPASTKPNTESTKKRQTPKVRELTVGTYTQEELMLAARLVDAEGGSTASMEGVATVLFNRLSSSKWPKTLQEVIFQDNQFSVVNSQQFMDRTPGKAAISAVEKVFVQGLAILPADVMFFKSDKLEKDWGNREYYDTIGGHHFYS